MAKKLNHKIGTTLRQALGDTIASLSDVNLETLDPDTSQYLRYDPDSDEWVPSPTSEIVNPESSGGAGGIKSFTNIDKTDGNFTRTLATWTAQAGLTATVAAEEGDIIEVNPGIISGITTGFGYVDLAILDGSNNIVRRISPSQFGHMGWIRMGWVNDNRSPMNGPKRFVVQSADIDGGNVKVGLVFRAYDGSGTHTWLATSDNPANMEVVVYGGPA